MNAKNRSDLAAQFLGDMPADEFGEAGSKLIDWINTYFQQIDSHSVLSEIKPGDIRKLLPTAPPKSGEKISDILGDLDKVIMPGMTHWNHPNFFAYFATSGSAAGIFGELAVRRLISMACFGNPAPLRPSWNR